MDSRNQSRTVMSSFFKSFAFAGYIKQILLLLFVYGQFFTDTNWIISVSAELDIVISSGPWVDNGTSTTLTCTSASSGTIREVSWRMSSFNGSLNDADGILLYIMNDAIYWGNSVDRNRYEFDQTLSGVPLTIKSVSLDDEAKYWCVLNIIGEETGTALMRVRVPPKAAAVSYMDTLYSIDSSPVLVVAGSDHQFTCETNGINPEAIFTWTYDSGMQQGTPQESTTNADDSRLCDSSNVITIDIPEIPAEQPLKCGATNRQDESTDTEVEINLMLQVKVPPKGSLMSLYDSSMELIMSGTPLAVDEGTPYTMTCKVQGTRPAVSIQWMVEGAPHQAADTTHSEVNGLIDTQGAVTFTPTRDNHRKNVICTANTSESESPYPFVTTVLDVTVFPSSITLSDSAEPYPSTGGTSYLVEGDDRQYTCHVPDINPGASFKWTVGNQVLDHSDKNVTDDSDGFTNSTSTASLLASFEHHHGRALKCLAINKEGTDGKSVSVTIDVKVPPNESSVSLSYSGKDLDPGASVSVKQGKEETLICTVRGSRPAATINLYRNGTSETTEDRILVGDGLVDTMENFVFTPQRDYHKQLVECVAKTNESTMPYPAANLTLDVDGPPNTPMISGSLTMTESVPTTVTCTADLGYPDDWTLEWSNEGTAIENPRNTTAVLSETSQRYMFTSQLEFTSKRQDNRRFIKCAANKTSWTSTPLPEQTWGPINVQYETNITNKHQTEVGIRSGLTANLSCVAKGNPAPVISWFDPNKTDIINGGKDNKYMVEVSHTTSDDDMTFGNVTTSKLTIRAVDGEVDYGVYTCNSTNGIGHQDSHEIILNGTRRPNKPNNVEMTGRTSSSIIVSWTAGYDGGEPQWFHVSHKKTADSSETFSDKIEGGVTTYNVTGLLSYMEYEIRVYAENDLGRNPNTGSIVEYTLPLPPGEDITIEFNKDMGTVEVSGLKGGCIQLEVKYEGSSDWTECGECITADTDELMLAAWCPQPKKRRRRAAGDVEDMQAKFCQGSGTSKVCSDPAAVKEVPSNPGVSNTADAGIIAGGVVGGIFLLVIIAGLIVYLRKTSPHQPKPTYTDTSSIELATDNFGQNGQVNEALQGSDSFDNISKKKEKKLKHPQMSPWETSSIKDKVDDEPVTTTTTGSVDQATKTVDEKPVKSSVRKSAYVGSINKGEKPPILTAKPSLKKPGLEETKSDESLQKKPAPTPMATTGGAETNAKPAVERMTTDSGDTYAIVKKDKLHPKPPPQNLPDVTYDVVKKTPVSGLAKKPKKYVPPSKVEDESAYEDVKLPESRKSKTGAGSSGYEVVNLDAPKKPEDKNDEYDDYASLAQPQNESGRTVNEDGLIYMEVGHLKTHPKDQPPIQTEESTTYASIDFSRTAPDVARN